VLGSEIRTPPTSRLPSRLYKLIPFLWGFQETCSENRTKLRILPLVRRVLPGAAKPGVRKAALRLSSAGRDYFFTYFFRSFGPTSAP
jgi:hypothetical protein